MYPLCGYIKFMAEGHTLTPLFTLQTPHYPQPLWNVENFLWKTVVQKPPPQGLWKRQKSSTLACAEKTIGAVREIGLIHISFPYYC
jgi:hypothetical protein